AREKAHALMVLPEVLGVGKHFEDEDRRGRVPMVAFREERGHRAEAGIARRHLVAFRLAFERQGVRRIALAHLLDEKAGGLAADDFQIVIAARLLRDHEIAGHHRREGEQAALGEIVDDVVGLYQHARVSATGPEGPAPPWSGAGPPDHGSAYIRWRILL